MRNGMFHHTVVAASRNHDKPLPRCYRAPNIGCVRDRIGAGASLCLRIFQSHSIARSSIA